MKWFKSRAAKVVPLPGEHAEASENPGGWVYRIRGNYGFDDGVPGHAVEGAWKVHERGKIVGEFTPNPHFRLPASSRD